MARAIAVLSGSTAGLLHEPFSHLGHRFSAFWQGVAGHLVSGYRPERHYMRGPGPAWHAKHGKAPSA